MRPDRAESPCARLYDVDPRAPCWVGSYLTVDTTEVDSPAHLASASKIDIPAAPHRGTGRGARRRDVE